MPLLFICKTHCHFIDKITNHRIIAQRGDLFNFMITSDKSVWRIKTHASLQWLCRVRRFPTYRRMTGDKISM